MITRPSNIDKPFANTGTRNTIPDAATGTSAASYELGFPPVTMQPVTAGGIPPDGKDFNGLLYSVTTHTLWVNAGGQYLFDAALSTAIGGYPKGMVLQNAALTASYISLIDNNTNNFNTDPSQIGVTWGSYAGSAFSTSTVNTTGGVTALTAVQALADVITVTGVLTSNASITVPAQLDEFIVLNKTTGAFTLTVYPVGTSTASGVQIKQGLADAVYCDATVVGYQQNSATTRSVKDASRSISSTLYADRTADRVGGGYADSGTANAYVVATVPPTTSIGDYQTVRFRASNASTGGACTLDVGTGVIPLVVGDGSDPRIGDITNQAITTATYVAALNKWIVNGLIVPDILISNAIYVAASRTLSRGNFVFNTAAGAFGCNLNATPNLGDTVYGADMIGKCSTNPVTIIPTGGKLIAYTDRFGTLVTMSTYVENVGGHSFTLVYDGTYWRLS